jgi:hypothetical protein
VLPDLAVGCKGAGRGRNKTRNTQELMSPSVRPSGVDKGWGQYLFAAGLALCKPLSVQVSKVCGCLEQDKRRHC